MLRIPRVFGLLLWMAVATGMSAQSLMHSALPGARAVGIGGFGAAGDGSPVAGFWNPAALAQSRDLQVQIISDAFFGFDYIGASMFLPQAGTFAIALSQFSLDSTMLDRGSISFARRLRRDLAIGGSLHVNLVDKENFATFSASLLFAPGAQNLPFVGLRSEAINFSPLYSSVPFLISVTAQDLRFGKKRLRRFADINMQYQPTQMPVVTYGGVRTNGHGETISFGVGWQPRAYLGVSAGIQDFKSRQAGLGVSLHGERQNLILGYGFDQKRVTVGLGIRLGRSPQRHARSHRERALELARKKSYRKAYAATRKSLAYDGGDKVAIQLKEWLDVHVGTQRQQVDSLLALADSLTARGQFINANITLLETVKVDPENTVARNEIERIRPTVDKHLSRLLELGEKAYAEQSFRNASLAFSTILQVRPEHEIASGFAKKLREYYSEQADGYFLRGLGFYKQKNYQRAIESFQEALGVVQGHRESVAYLDSSRTAFRQQTRRTGALLTQAEGQLTRKNYVRAREIYREILEIDPHHAESKSKLRWLAPRVQRHVQTLIRNGKAAFARSELDLAQSLFSSALDADATRSEAREFLQRITTERKRQVEAEFLLAEEYFARQDWQKAIDVYDEILEQDADHKRARERRHEAILLGDFNQVSKEAELAFQNADYGRALPLYQKILAMDGNNDYALRQIELCLRELTRIVEQHFNAGISFFTAENYAAAIQEWDKALKINPGHAKSLEYKNRAKQRLKALDRL